MLVQYQHTSSSFHQKIIYSRRSIAEKLSVWYITTIADSLHCLLTYFMDVLVQVCLLHDNNVSTFRFRTLTFVSLQTYPFNYCIKRKTFNIQNVVVVQGNQSSHHTFKITIIKPKSKACDRLETKRGLLSVNGLWSDQYQGCTEV